MQFSTRASAVLMLAVSLGVFPVLAHAQTQQRAATPAQVAPTVAPVVTPTHTKPPAPSPAVTTVESDIPLCTELTDILPETVEVLYVDCKSAIGLACLTTITFYGASTSCSNVFVRPTATPTPTPAPAN